jgi:two-component system sensor histidine kinase RegB
MASIGLGSQTPAGHPVVRFLARIALDSAQAGRVRVHTVTVMRWVAVVGQLFTILFVHFSLAIPLPLGALLPAVGLTAALNLLVLALVGSRARLSERAAALLFAWDIVQLCWLLVLTGGLQNPFAVLMVLPVALAAATLGFAATALLTGLALLGSAALALLAGPLPWREGGLTLPPLFVLAVWTALSMAVMLIASFAWSIAEEVRRHAAALAQTQLALERERKLSALGGQAAAAAHLLGSPLGTIRITAKELVRELPADSPLLEDARELLAQAHRCGEILATLARGPEPMDHAPFTRAPLSSLLSGIAAEVARPEIVTRVTVERGNGAAEPQLHLPAEIRHALTNLIDNAIEFARTSVEIAVRSDGDGVQVTIQDDGPGFSPEVLDWLGEPYLSTRQGEGGMGLGVFIAQTLLARTGATLHFCNSARGARVEITWPAGCLDRLSEESDDGGRAG